MAKYKLNSDDSILNQGQVRALHKNKSLPKVWTQETCDLLGITPITETPKPQPSSDVVVVIPDGTKLDSLGNTVLNYVEKPMFLTDEEGTQAEKEAAYLADKANKVKKVKRKDINKTRNDAYEKLTVPIDKDAITHNIEAHAKGRSEINGAITGILIDVLIEVLGQPLIDALSDPTKLTQWTTAEDADIEFNRAEIIQIGQAVKQAYADTHASARTEKKKL